MHLTDQRSSRGRDWASHPGPGPAPPARLTAAGVDDHRLGRRRRRRPLAGLSQGGYDGGPRVGLVIPGFEFRERQPTPSLVASGS